MNVLTTKIDAKTFFLKGRIAKQMCNPESNIYRFFNPINDWFEDFINKTNIMYLGAYPCLSDVLIKEHMLELGIPDNVFNNSDPRYRFTYTFPVHFGDPPPIVRPDDRVDDVIIKKYIIHDNSYGGMEKVANQYGLCAEIETKDNDLNPCGFPYTLPLVFCGYENEITLPLKYQHDPIDCSFYEINPITGDVTVSIDCEADKYKDLESEYKNTYGDSVCKITTVTIYDADAIVFAKIERILNEMKPLGTYLVVKNVDSSTIPTYTPCTITKFCETTQ